MDQLQLDVARSMIPLPCVLDRTSSSRTKLPPTRGTAGKKTKKNNGKKMKPEEELYSEWPEENPPQEEGVLKCQPSSPFIPPLLQGNPALKFP